MAKKKAAKKAPHISPTDRGAPAISGTAQPTWPLGPWGLLAAISIVMATVWAYSNTFGVPFLLDDLHTITENPSIKKIWSLGDILLPPAYIGTAGRPIANLTLALNYYISGHEVWSYHLVNLVIHLLAALTLFGVVRRSCVWNQPDQISPKMAAWLAWGIAAIWAVHPLHSTAVTYISQRCESLMGLFFLTTIYCAIRGWQAADPRRWHLVAIIAALAGTGVKEVIAVVPVIIFLYDLTFVHRRLLEAWRSSRFLYLGLGLSWALMAILVVLAGKLVPDPRIKVFSAWEQLATQPEVLVHYLRLAFWPTGLCFDYVWPVATFSQTWPSAVFLTVLLLASVWAFWKRQLAGFLGLSFFIILAPSSSFVPQPDFAFEYKMYLPLAALIALVVVHGYKAGRLGLYRFTSNENVRRQAGYVIGGSLLAVLVIGLGVSTYVRNKDFQSEMAIWNDTVKKRPQSARAHYNLGLALDRDGRTAEAIPHLQLAISLDPEATDLYVAYASLGAALGKLGQHEEAIKYFRESIRVQPQYAMAYINLGTAFLQLNRPQEAIPYFQEALRLKPEMETGYYSLGYALFQIGQLDSAISSFKKALQINPSFAPAREALERLGQSQKQ